MIMYFIVQMWPSRFTCRAHQTDDITAFNVAAFLQNLMAAVVSDGTGAKLSNQSYEAFGKTGTAQVSDSTDQTNAWFVGYGKKDGYNDLAIAVIVEDSGAGSTYAVPVAKKVFDKYFNE